MDTNIIRNGLNNKRIFIVGGTGFVGKNILNYLKIHEIEFANVTILTRNINNFKSSYPELTDIPNLSYHECDVLNLKYFGSDFDFVINGATASIQNVNSTQLLNESILGTLNVLEYAKNASVSSLINLSSGAVYGEIKQKVAVIEDSLQRPKIENQANSYGLGKLMSEHYAYLFASNQMKVTSLRCFCFGGPYLDFSYYVLGYMISNALQNQDILLKSGSGVYRSYLSSNDLVEAIFMNLINAKLRDSNYEVYNLGSEDAYSVHDLAKIVKNNLNSKSKIVYQNNNEELISYYIPNMDKFKKTGISLESKLTDVIGETAKYYIQYYGRK